MSDKTIPDPPPPTLEESLIHISELMRCAAATAYENADNLHGEQRDLALSTRHLIDIARTHLDNSLRRLEAR